MREALQEVARNGQYVQDNGGNTYDPCDIIDITEALRDQRDNDLERPVYAGCGYITYLDEHGFQVGGEPLWQIVEAEEVHE
jgi:hypothetical protein